MFLSLALCDWIRPARRQALTGETVKVLGAWLKERCAQPAEPLFPTRQGRALRRYTVGVIVAKHTATATTACSSLQGKRVTPHMLRHYVDGWVMWPAAMFPVVGCR